MQREFKTQNHRKEKGKVQLASSWPQPSGWEGEDPIRSRDAPAAHRLPTSQPPASHSGPAVREREELSLAARKRPGEPITPFISVYSSSVCFQMVAKKKKHEASLWLGGGWGISVL